MAKWLIALLTTISLTLAVEIVSDRLSTDPDGNLIAEGNVKVSYKDYIIRADKIKYNPDTKDVFAYGNVHIRKRDGTFEVFGEEAYMNLNTRRGYFINAEGKFRGFFFSANRIEKVGKNKFVVYDGEITTCPPNRKEMKLCFWRAYVSNRYVFSYSNSLKLSWLPVGYSPIMIFPIGERRSGFLPPMIGTNTYNSFIYIQPFFWVISKDKDATFTLDYRSEQAKGGSVEYRQAFTERDRFFFRLSYYKEPAPPGEWWTGREPESFREDRFRIEIGLGYRGWKLGLDLPSDPYFFEDVYFSQKDRTKPYTLSYIGYSRLGRDYLLSFNLRSYYDLTSPDNRRTLNLLPEFSFYSRANKFGPAYINLTTTFTNFNREEGPISKRFIFIPQLEIPSEVLGMRNYLSLSFINNFYFADAEDPGDEQVTTVYVEDKVPVFWNWSSKFLSLSNVFELVYTFSPRNFDNPQFDSFDRITKENNFKLRMRGNISSEERVLMSLFLEGGYNILRSYRFPTDNRLMEKELLPIRLILSTNPFKWLTLREDLTYDPNIGVAAMSVSSAMLKVGNFSFNGSYITTKNSQNERTGDQYTVGTGVNLRGILLGASLTRDNRIEKELYMRFYLGYKGACWALKVDYRRTYYGTQKGYLREVYLVFNVFNLRDFKLPLRRK